MAQSVNLTSAKKVGAKGRVDISLGRAGEFYAAYKLQMAGLQVSHIDGTCDLHGLADYYILLWMPGQPDTGCHGIPAARSELYGRSDNTGLPGCNSNLQ